MSFWRIWLIAMCSNANAAVTIDSALVFSKNGSSPTDDQDAVKREMMAIGNPFGDYGNIVYGSRFIGRRSYLQEIEARVVQSPGGNLAIIGQRRVGKSSLAYQGIMIRRSELLQQRILPIRVSVSTYDTSPQFFCDLVSICFRQLQDLGWAERRIREAAEEVATRGADRLNFSELKDFYKETYGAGIRIIFVLDEFDKTVRFCSGDPSFFDRLRELSYRGRTTLLTISRDPLAAIEQRANITSSLVGTVHDQYLGMFEESELDEHFDKLKATGVKLTAGDRRLIVDRCGGCPYLHDKIAFELVERFRHDGQVLIEHAFHRSERVLLREFEVIIKNLRNRGLLDPLMQALFAS